MGEMCNQEVKEYMSLKQQNNKFYNGHTVGGTYYSRLHKQRDS